MELYNDCGRFRVEYGVLKDFECAKANQVKENVWKCLDIPEGVRVIPEEMFHGCRVLEYVRFPESLVILGTGHAGAFAWCDLPDIELPRTLKELGGFTFAKSTLRSLRIPKGLKSEYGRQFKESSIGTLYLPEEFRADGTPYGFCEKYQWGQEQYGYIRSMLVNNVRIGEVIFE